MLEAFKSYIESKQLFSGHDRILLAVSGGIDSVVMTDLFHKAGYDFGIAHVNFKLRGEESDVDQKFVEALANTYNVSFYVSVYDTKTYAKEHHLSTQMAARELRYRFFQNICEKHQYNYIATAHHKNDQFETFFINLLRGTGISGLRGIKAKQNNIIRPLLFADRKTIEQFQQSEQLKFREDSSNASDKYLRNKIRHQLAPVLKDIDPKYLDTINANMLRFGESEEIYKQHITELRSELFEKRKHYIYISIDKLKSFNPRVTYTYELIKNWNFSFAIAEDIVRSLDHETGKIFTSETHELLKDRDHLIIRKKEYKSFTPVLINEDDLSVNNGINLKLEHILRNDEFQVSKENHIIELDKNKLSFPLTIRKWEQGDYFYPLGSKFKKKLSDYFIDQKFSLFEKEDVFLLCTGTDIVWIIEHQIDDHFKVTPQTKEILRIERQSSSLI